MAAKLTAEQFFEKVKALHPTLDFSKSEYLGSMQPLTFHCPEHGEQSARAGNVLQGRGCPKCGRKKSGAWVAALDPSAKEALAAKARSGRSEDTSRKIAESQKLRWASDEAGKVAQSERAKKIAVEQWAAIPPEERKARMATVRAAKQKHQQ